MNEKLRDTLETAGIDAKELQGLVDVALLEDLRFGPDVTSEATIALEQEAEAEVIARQPGVVCGVTVAIAVLESVGFPISGVTIIHQDGDVIGAQEPVLHLSGPLRPLLLAERTMLNLMTHLSGVATATSAWVRTLEGTGCKVRDTRKTTPGLRQLEKYAVRCGGGVNHRMGLGDAALVKDNHIAAAGGITQAVRAIRESHPDIILEVECDTLEQVLEAVDAKCSLILLDNMNLEQVKSAVAIARRRPGIRIEASGGMTIGNARAVAVAGADYIAVGSLTHSAVALDLGLDLVTRISPESS
jgi:nicotinate-nucleotide pyrophosphorylase (carboxylating)